MSTHYKAMLVVMAIAVLVFLIGKPLLCKFMAPADFVVRRNVWLGLNLAAFLIPQYWAYVGIASVLLAYGAKRDSNPAALYMSLQLAMLPVGLNVPTFGLFNQLFVLDHLRLLALVVLLPMAIGLARQRGTMNRSPYQYGGRCSIGFPADVLLLSYAALQIGLLMPYESITGTFRRMVLLGIDVLLPYYVLSRACRTRESVVDVMAGFALAMFVAAALAAFEVAKGWLLYLGIQDQWAAPAIVNYLMRGDYLRAQVSSGHSIVLGYAMAVAFGFWLYLQSRVAARGWRWLAMLTLVAGILLPFARGPWLGAALLLLVFLGLGPNRANRLFKVIGLFALGGVLSTLLGYGDKIIDALPFVGTLDESTIDYRQRLAEQSWLLIQQNPFFGSPWYLAHLEELRQGQGIIDLVNAYAGIALAYGLVGLGLFVGFFGFVVIKAVRAIRAAAGSDPDLSLMGASLVACMIAGLFMIATVNLYLSVASITWSLAGLTVSYLVLSRQSLTDTALRAPWLAAATP